MSGLPESSTGGREGQCADETAREATELRSIELAPS